MTSNSIVFYIPHVFPCGNWREFGGVSGMKKYIRMAFSGDESPPGEMKIGLVKHIDIVQNKKTTSMIDDYCAFVRFVPSGSEFSIKLLSNVDKDKKFRFFHNQQRGFYWDFYLSSRGKRQREEETMETICSAINDLCVGTRSTKRRRIS